MRKLLLLELLLRWQSWRVQSHPAPSGEMGRFARLVAVTLAVEAILALWVMGGFRPLSAL